MTATRNLVRARKIRQLQADTDKRTESIAKHRTQILKNKAELKSVRKVGAK